MSFQKLGVDLLADVASPHEIEQDRPPLRLHHAKRQKMRQAAHDIGEDRRGRAAPDRVGGVGPQLMGKHPEHHVDGVDRAFGVLLQHPGEILRVCSRPLDGALIGVPGGPARGADEPQAGERNGDPDEATERELSPPRGLPRAAPRRCEDRPHPFPPTRRLQALLGHVRAPRDDISHEIPCVILNVAMAAKGRHGPAPQPVRLLERVEYIEVAEAPSRALIDHDLQGLQLARIAGVEVLRAVGENEEAVHFGAQIDVVARLRDRLGDGP